jgi:type II secretory pathway pseudopilin PulG
MYRTNRTRRTAFTLVEVIAATAIMAALTTSSFALVRTAHQAWSVHRDDSQQRQQAIATLQHVMRRVRQATAVTMISAPADASGALTLQMADGSPANWDHDAGSSQVLYGQASPSSQLSEGITEIRFVGMTANGLATTTDVTKIHLVSCAVTYTLSRPAGPITETVSRMAWLRSW